MHLLTQSALLKALGGELLNSLWQMALLWLLYRGGMAVFAKASAHVRHGLALLFLTTGVMWATATFSIDYFFSGALPGVRPWWDVVSRTGGYSFLLTGRQLIDEALPYCSFGYLLVLAFLFIRYSNQYFHSRQLKGQGLSKIQPGLRIFVEETSRRMGIRKKVQVWLSSRVEGPVTLGFIKPVILIPVAMINNLSLQQVEAVLLHELAHIKRYDYLVHLVVTMIEKLFFFNPFVRWMVRDIKKEREHCCDDVVIQQFRYSPHVYISALLSLAGNNPERQQLALAAAGGSEQLLLQRVRRILRVGEVKDRPGAKALIFLLLSLAGVVLLLSGRQTPGANIAIAMPAGIPAFSQSSHLPSTVVLSPEGDLFPAAPVSGRAGRVFRPQPMTPGMVAMMPGMVAIHIEMKAPKVVIPSSSILHKKFRAVLSDDKREASGAEDNDVIAAENEAPEKGSGNGEFAAIVQPDDREYSMGPSENITITAAPARMAIRLRQPFVPSASFSFQQIEDTTRLTEKYAYLQSLAAHDLVMAVKKMQKELQVQLQVLQVARSKDKQTALKVQKQLLQEQLRLQEQFLQKQQELERKLERAGKIRRIVVI